MMNAGYRVCRTALDEHTNPFCPHGPTLLFERVRDDGTVAETFYGCSACRDRKHCNFYMLHGTKESAEKVKLRMQLYREANAQYADCSNVTSVKCGTLYCTECDQLLHKPPCAKNHSASFIKSLTPDEIASPTKWLKAKISNQSNAQYFFSPQVVCFVAEMLQRLGFTHVICLGTPRLHEYLEDRRHPKKLDSFLLDIDARLKQFHQRFAHFNMFNQHFFEPNGRIKLQEFCSEAQKLVLVVDPPYGGLVEPIAWTLEELSRIDPRSKNDLLPILLFFPYFMEPQLSKHLPCLVMSDYKVNYDNHCRYKGGPTGRTRGSPARIYTNIPLKDLLLPVDQGYRFCAICERFVSKENLHCSKCNACTTKDGSSYVHCDRCGKCVKPSRVHCDKCRRCDLPSHSCTRGETSAGLENDGAATHGCRRCGDDSHKFRQCTLGAKRGSTGRTKRPRM